VPLAVSIFAPEQQPHGEKFRERQSLNLLFSFRARLVLFVLLILFVTIVILLVINRHSERRIAQLVNDHHRDTSLAVDLAQTSFPSGSYIYKLIEQDGRLRVGLDESHIIHRILIADADGRIIDSSERADIDQPIDRILGELTPAPYAKPSATVNPGAREPEQILSYPVETERGIRRVVIVISPHRLGEIVREERWERWLGITSLSLLLLCTVALASWRFTRPINELMQAAGRVSAGDFDFNLNIARRDEMGLLARTFNEMLNGLRGKRELEERLQRAERSALTGRIAAGIAHEIRNPLSFINLTVDYIRDKYAPAAEDARRDYTQLIDSVKEEIVRLNGMVSDFLNFGRPARLKLRELDARELVAEVVTLVRAKAELQQGPLTCAKPVMKRTRTFNFRQTLNNSRPVSRTSPSTPCRRWRTAAR
jgi:signal transduction histidine kinase